MNNNSNNICSECNESITNSKEIVKFHKIQFHPDCFICSRCGLNLYNIEESSFIFKDEKLFCESCDNIFETIYLPRMNGDIVCLYNCDKDIYRILLCDQMKRIVFEFNNKFYDSLLYTYSTIWDEWKLKFFHLIDHDDNIKSLVFECWIEMVITPIKIKLTNAILKIIKEDHHMVMTNYSISSLSSLSPTSNLLYKIINSFIEIDRVLIKSKLYENYFGIMEESATQHQQEQQQEKQGIQIQPTASLINCTPTQSINNIQSPTTI
ncbi:hypothetical protein CYY_009838 [Polysphondylium violaceum]|uniref:LIM zinc-binding domain-containing protein n=1 Tax=Polysphondylium violaceum TaxID=133409 RepID=A0A8J4PKT5_9MYCE|nr:hypothetical protein CYY_009838 [Polysphondylium violaceum]